MLKIFKLKQSHAYYGKSAMETGDHSKNGASPKSLMSRIIIFVLLLPAAICNAQVVKYDSIAPYSEGMAAVKLGDKWGYIDGNKKLVIPLQFKLANPFFEGLAAVYDNENKSGYIDKIGKLTIPYKFEYCGNFKDGLATVRFDGKVGFIDRTGKKVIPCKYEYANNFREGFSAVTLNGKAGYIDKTGKEVIPNKYNIAKDFSFGYAFVKLEDKWQIINQKGEEFNYSIWDKDLELLRLKVDGKIGYIDKTAKLVTPLKYDKANELDKNIAVTQIGDKLGVVGKSGEITEPKYDEIFAPSEGFRIVKHNNKYGYIDNETGKEITPIKYDKAYTFDNGVAQVRIDSEGLIFDENLLEEINGIIHKYGLIDKSGKEIVPVHYEDIGFFYDGLAYIINPNGKVGYIDKTGKIIIPMKYSHLYQHLPHNFNGGIAIVLIDGKLDRDSYRNHINKGFETTGELDDMFTRYCKVYIDKQGNEYKTEEEARKSQNRK
jgi:hypothetical protein